jgi:pyridoxal phosphate enzyme (YggS family)
VRDRPYLARVDFAAKLAEIQSRIDAACARAGRPPGSVELMAVSKNQPVSAVTQAVHGGVRLFGESRVQEARVKIPQCPAHLRWHLIGHLQTNKARDAVTLFDTIQSVDSLPLARELQKRADAAAKTIRVLLEVNVAGESTKFGYPPAQLLKELTEINQLRRLEIHGLMCMAPFSLNPETTRPVFRRCRELLHQCP